jgi:hypothetical protein
VFPLAHAGHWALWVLYAIPILIVLGSIVLQMVRGEPEDETELDAGDGGGRVDEGEPREGQPDP